MVWFPAIKDAWFQTNGRQLRLSPAGLVVVQPTHFPYFPANSIGYTAVDGIPRAAGRNVTFQMLMAVAYQSNLGLIYLPVGAPTNNFDFLVTVRTNHRERFRKAILNATGYSAHTEMRDTDVLALKVENSYSSGLSVSSPDEKTNMNLKKGRLYLTHMKLMDVVNGLEGILKMPVVDETGLTNFYDLSLDWKRGMNPQMLTRDDIDKIVGGWGLGLEPDTESVEMLVVKKID
jgi:uncharacterized protein (TIGR03435 family)